MKKAPAMGLQCFGMGVERRDILGRYTSAARLGVIGETQVVARLRLTQYGYKSKRPHACGPDRRRIEAWALRRVVGRLARGQGVGLGLGDRRRDLFDQRRERGRRGGVGAENASLIFFSTALALTACRPSRRW